MRRRVQHILLVSNLYDSFVLVEDGRLNEAINRQYSALNLSQTPDLTRVSSGREALRMAQEDRRFDLILANQTISDMDAATLARSARRAGLDMPVSVLAFNDRALGDFYSAGGVDAVDRVYLWQGDAKLLLAIVKDVEDRWNLAHDVGEFGVPVILVIEDDVRFYSALLPAIYTELMAYTNRLIAEGLNLAQKTLRQRARVKVLLCRNYEEAWAYFTRFDEHVLGIISDIAYPRGGKLDKEAGLELVRRVREVRADIPVVLQSSQPGNARLAERIGARFLLKGSPKMLRQLRQILNESFGFGDFVFSLPDGREVGRASDLRGLVRELRRVPAESITYHGERNHFSFWLKARTEFGLAAELRPRTVASFGGPDELRESLIRILGAYRRQRDRVVVADFDRDEMDTESSISRIGSGSIGGKARGLAFVNRLLAEAQIHKRYPDVRVTVPRAAVIGTDVFEQFLEQGDLRSVALESNSDQEILRRVLDAPFPVETLKDLRAFLTVAKYPIAVRSSALLEDSPFHPFSGVYRTVMLPNNDPDLDVRLHQLTRAIRQVYASTFSHEAKEFLQLTPYRLEEEGMAVIIQRIAGTRHGKRFYPDFAGVARSYNFYPAGPLRPEDGIVAVGLGLGRTVVEGDECLRFSPAAPERALGFSSAAEARNNSQRSFFALDLDQEPGRQGGEGIELSRYGLDVAEQDGVLAPAGSTYDAENDRMYDGVTRDGIRLVTFSPILKHNLFPLAPLLNDLLRLGKQGTGSDVEIEFAVNLNQSNPDPPEFGYLQMRPLAMCGGTDAVEIGDVSGGRALCVSDHVLGNGVVEGIHDLIVVDFHRFDRSHSHEAALEVARQNGLLHAEERPYVLIGVGRWGSADPLLGIPVNWTQIAGARVIVEAGFRDFKVLPSQGTHFFQNLVQGDVGYFTVNPEANDGLLDWDWLAAQPGPEAVHHVRHIRLAGPVSVRMCGLEGHGAILKPT